jgi:chemotaxis protein methyltransferase CheR
MTVASLPLDSATFEYVRKLVLDRAAIALEPTKEYLVEARLLPLARRLGLASLRDLVASLREQPFGDLHAQVVEAMTTNETSFFRDIYPFEALKRDVLPALIAARQASRRLRIWSAACSSGQEAYSIAMILAEYFPELEGWNIQIHGSDLSQQVLERAIAGRYTQLEVNRGVPASLLLKYFEKSGAHWQIRPTISRRVRFVRMNLIDPWTAVPACDIIFLRNVLIYFTPDTKRTILARVRRHLDPGGTLFLGGAETTLGIDNAWQRVSHGKASTYRLASQPH